MLSLSSLFSRQPAALLGLDVRSSSVKLVELGQDRSGRLVLENCAIVPLERGWITDGNIEKFDEVADAVRRAREIPHTVIIDFRVEQMDSVYPMVPAGAALDAMIRRPESEPEAQPEAQHNPIFETGKDK